MNNSIQSKIGRKTAIIKRKLFDNAITLVGSDVKCVRIKTEKNMYEDVEILSVIDNDYITANVVIPSNIPLSRLRGDSIDNVNDSSSLFFYDILPIDVYSKWEDNVEKGDIIIFEIFDERDEILKIILKISDTVTKFKIPTIVWKKSLAAPYNGDKEFLTDYLI